MTKTLKTLEGLAATIRDAGDIDNPDWESCFQSWRSYIPREVRLVWAQLPREARLIAVILASEAENREEWE